MSCRSGLLAIVALLALLHPPTVAAQELLVFAAASLQDALNAASRHYQRRAGVGVTISYAGSSALARQIEQGAPADVFISANVRWMDYLEERKRLATGSRVDLLRNRLVLIAPSPSPVRLTIAPNFPLAAALGKGRLAMADPDHVPAGLYGKAALETLGVWRSVAARVARTDNVRGAVALVARGEAALGIVYRTDVLTVRSVRTVAEFPESVHPAIVYRGAVLANSKRELRAREWLAFLRSVEAAAVFEQYGFTVVQPQ